MIGEQAIFNLDIKKKCGLSINPDIHHSKVFSSVGPDIKTFLVLITVSFLQRITLMSTLSFWGSFTVISLFT